MSFNNISTHDGATEASATNLIATNPSTGMLQQSGGQQYSLSAFRSPAQYHRHSISNSKSAVNAAQNMENSQYMSVPIPVPQEGQDIEI
jgi:hypothetical protein